MKDKESSEQLQQILHTLELEEKKNQAVVSLGAGKITLSNLNKVLWPGNSKAGSGISKRDYLKYLCLIAAELIPHLKDRPLTMIRYPDGIKSKSFFQKHWPHQLPEFVETITYFSETNNEDKEYFLCNNFPTLIWLGQIAALELHTAHTRIKKEPDADSLSTNFTGSLKAVEGSVLDYPDYLVLDLDPYLYSGKEKAGEEPELHRKGFQQTCKVALILKEILDSMNLRPLLKTSGKTGLHVYVPLVRNCNNDELRAIAGTIGKHLVAEHPAEITIDWTVKKRNGKVFFDHNMNARGKTLPAPYSPRNSAEASVSTPISWEELDKIYPTDFTILTVPDRVQEIGDLWTGFLTDKRDIRAAIKASERK